MGVYFGQDYSAMQGPAPDGFHVPLNTEWQAVKDIRTALGGGSGDGPNFGIALKLPMAGYRDKSSANVKYQGSDGDYWSSSCYDTNTAYCLHFYSSAIYPDNCITRSYGYSIRCFKDSPTIPTSSWTKLYGTSIEAGGIFWDNTDGLISLSSDGNTWITIADKNLGATTVWNSGDTLSEANCGKYYQWGNNYGFPRTGSVTTSSTQVDASNYGPGNYYSSSTFITRSSSPYRWDTTDNGNLWGGETGIRPGELYKAYIGEYTARLPSAYQEVERIGTSGSQWIDTGFVISGVTGIQTETKIAVNTTSQNIPIFGCRRNDNTSAYSSTYYHLTPYSSKWYYGTNGTEKNAGTYGNTVGTQYTIIFNNSNSKISVNGTEIGDTSNATGYSSAKLAISRRGTNRSGDLYYGRWNYYYFNIYNRNTSTYERQMIPCYRKSDSVIGMYDLVTNTFYTNNGTGTFTKGNDVD